MVAIDAPHTALPIAAPPQSAVHRRGVLFWVIRYLPAEIVGTAAMVVAGVAVSGMTSHPATIALAGLVGESVGFYAVLAVTIYLEQMRVAPSRRRAAARSMLLLVAEFGPAELLDSLLVRPAALLFGVWLVPDPLWGLLIGKFAADFVFYAIAAGSYLMTARTGLRDRARSAAAA